MWIRDGPFEPNLHRAYDEPATNDAGEGEGRGASRARPSPPRLHHYKAVRGPELRTERPGSSDLTHAHLNKLYHNTTRFHVLHTHGATPHNPDTHRPPHPKSPPKNSATDCARCGSSASNMNMDVGSVRPSRPAGSGGACHQARWGAEAACTTSKQVACDACRNARSGRGGGLHHTRARQLPTGAARLRGHAHGWRVHAIYTSSRVCF